MNAVKSVLPLFLIICLFSFFSPFHFAHADSFPAENPPAIPEENVVYNEEELMQWFDSHSGEGGTVKLGDNIVITKPFVSAFNPAQFIIEAGPYGLVYDGAYIFAEGNLTIVGEGVDRPVVDIADTGGGMFRLHWIHAIQALHIVATGRDGAGGIAVRTAQENNPPAYFDYITMEGSIKAAGAGSIGLELMIPSDVYCLNIAVTGEGSTAIRAHRQAEFYYCKLSGAETISGAGPFLMDTCVFHKTPENTQILNHTIAKLPGSYLFIPQNETIGYIESFLSFPLQNEEGHPARTEQLHVIWDKDPNTIDTSLPGKSEFTFSLSPPFRGLGLEKNIPLAITLDVRDPALPCVESVDFLQKNDDRYARLHLWKVDPADWESLLLWRSDDMGQSWYDYTSSPQIKWLASDLTDQPSVDFYYDDIEYPVQFQLELPGAGESNIVTLYLAGEGAANTGGDRIGTDRIIVFPGGENPDPVDAPDDGQEQGQIQNERPHAGKNHTSDPTTLESILKMNQDDTASVNMSPAVALSAAPPAADSGMYPVTAKKESVPVVQIAEKPPATNTNSNAVSEVVSADERAAAVSNAPENGVPEKGIQERIRNAPAASAAWILFALLLVVFVGLLFWRVIRIRR